MSVTGQKGLSRPSLLRGVIVVRVDAHYSIDGMGQGSEKAAMEAQLADELRALALRVDELAAHIKLPESPTSPGGFQSKVFGELQTWNAIEERNRALELQAALSSVAKAIDAYLGFLPGQQKKL